MNEWDEPNNLQLEALKNALTSAYPTPALFSQFLLLRLGKYYAELVPAHQTYDVALLDVLYSQARAEGWLPRLVASALEDKPNNPKLMEFINANIDWVNPNHSQLEQLQQALMHAYPTPDLFSLFLLLKLNKPKTYDVALLGILVNRAKAEGWLSDLVAKALQDKPNNPKLKQLNRSFPLTAVNVPDNLGLTLQDIVRPTQRSADVFPWIDQLERLASQVCRIEDPVGQARGTGWLVGPDLVLTNWHVVCHALKPDGLLENGITCRFDYAVHNGQAQEGQTVALASDGNLVASSPPSPSELGAGAAEPSADTLDYALLRLDQKVGEASSPLAGKRGWVELSATTSLPTANGDALIVVQHPAGEPVKLAIGGYRGTKDMKLRIKHDANTTNGSSGSPLVNAELKPIGLHHAGDTLYQQGNLGNPQTNQAIPLMLIIQDLVSKGIGKFWKD